MQDELKTLASSLGKTLSGLIFLYSKGRSIQMLRKESTINITLKPEDMSKPTSGKVKFKSFKKESIDPKFPFLASISNYSFT